jgi:hypothetical protein
MPNEAEKLARIARLRRRLWFWPLIAAPLILFEWWTRRSSYWIAGIAIWWLACLALGLFGLSSARCPRCGGRFFARRFLPIGNACASCGLPLKERHVVYPTLE